MTHDADSLRNIFCRPFDSEAWRKLLRDLTGDKGITLRKEEQKIDLPQGQTGEYLGRIDTADRYSIGLFLFPVGGGGRP